MFLQQSKGNLIIEQVYLQLMDGENKLLSSQSVRTHESLARKYLTECDEVGGGLFQLTASLDVNG